MYSALKVGGKKLYELARAGREVERAARPVEILELQVEEIEERVGERSGDTYRILMAHNPAYMDVYWEWGADLVLSGHLHGGVVRLPLVGGVITPQMQLFPRYSGDMYKGKDGQSCVVSRGLGTHTVNVRLYNMAELVSLTFVGKQG